MRCVAGREIEKGRECVKIKPVNKYGLHPTFENLSLSLLARDSSSFIEHFTSLRVSSRAILTFFYFPENIFKSHFFSPRFVLYSLWRLKKKVVDSDLTNLNGLPSLRFRFPNDVILMVNFRRSFRSKTINQFNPI